MVDPREGAIYALLLVFSSANAVISLERILSKGMANLEDATERLQKALQSLEAAVNERAARDEALRGDVDAIRSENLRLQDALESVSGRLDQTIDRIRTMMGE